MENKPIKRQAALWETSIKLLKNCELSSWVKSDFCFTQKGT